VSADWDEAMPSEDVARYHARSMGQTDIYEMYDVDDKKVIGSGSYGKVLKGKHKESGRSYAIKLIKKLPKTENYEKARKNQTQTLKQEMVVMQNSDHPNIVRLFDYFEDHTRIYLIMDLCTGGKLIDFVARMKDFKESDASLLMKQAFAAMSYLHGSNILHRDVKPDNMLLESRSRPLEENTLKLVDFGLSCNIAPGQEVRLVAGTREYISPQAIDGRYGTQTDMWSCGVTMYVLLCGYAPFRAESEAGLFAAIKRGNFVFPVADWRSVTENAKELIRSLLRLSPGERCTADQALEHEWVRQRAEGGERLPQAHKRFRQEHASRRRPQAETSRLSVVVQWASSMLPRSMLGDSADSSPTKSRVRGGG